MIGGQPFPRSERVCMVTGSIPGARCGVEDYTVRLNESLSSAGAETRILRHEDWSVGGTLRAAGAVRALGPAVVHLQYPTLAYGRSLGPQLLGLLAGVRPIVTLHEYSAFGRAKRAALAFFAVTARHIIFTTEFERAAFLRQYPGCRGRSSVIPIGSNIPFLEPDPSPDPLIVFFGQLRPGRGLEAVLDLARLARARGVPWQFVVAGGLLPDHLGYVERLRADSAGLPVEWRFDLEPAAIARQLTRATIAYLPYPDGVSARRGTLVAALGNSAAIVTTNGPFRPPGIEAAVRFADSPADAFRVIGGLLAHDTELQRLRREGARFAWRFGWDGIGAAHLDLYSRLATPARRSVNLPTEGTDLCR